MTTSPAASPAPGPQVHETMPALPDLGARVRVDTVKARTWLGRIVEAYPDEAEDISGEAPTISAAWYSRSAGAEWTAERLVRAAVEDGVLICPPGMDVNFVHERSSGDGSYHFEVSIGHDVTTQVSVNTLGYALRLLGDPDATGVEAAMSILCEAESLTNKALADLTLLLTAQAATGGPRNHPAAGTGPVAGTAIIHCGLCGAEIEEQDTGLWETGGDTADQRRHCTDSTDHLHHPPAPGLPGHDGTAHGSGGDYGDECVITLATGWTIRTDSAADSPAGSTYVRVCDPGGDEAGRYWISDEWREAPEEVMGAILGAAKGSEFA